jgi:D-3-phosphoglycerate dehydrogenase
LIAYDPYVSDEVAREFHCELTTQAEVVRRADFLSLHLPVLDETRNLVNAALLGQMKAGSFLINTARGELIDETALVQALQSRHIKGAALDAFRVEPPDADHPLLSLPQVILTPHMGAHTDGATNAMGWMALNNCLAVLRGDEPENRIV